MHRITSKSVRPLLILLAAGALTTAGCGALNLAGPGRTSGPATNLTAAAPPASVPGRSTSTGWTVTVYYTAVESFHHGHPKQVHGCPTIDCDHGNTDLGSYPADFVQAVHDEGTGRISSSPHAGQYLNWSSGVGYWLDTAARDTHGHPLRPFHSAAADGVPEGTAVRLLDCGHLDDGSAPPPDVCARLRKPSWEISDAFTPGLGGPHHIDLYIGAETHSDFTRDPLYTTLIGVTLDLG